MNPAAETAEPGPAAPVRPATGVVWAWWSKRAKTARDYAVVDANIGAEHWPAINAEIDRLGVGNPSSGSAPGRALPWIAFAGRPGRDPEQRVLVWDWTGESDVGGRPIVGVLYLRLPADRRAGLRVLAEYAFHAWHAVRDDRSVVLPEPPGAVPQPDMLQWLEDEDQLRWIAAVAALALVRPVRVVGGEEHTLAHNSSRVWLFDAVEALLPAGVQPLLSHASWLNDAKNERYQLALSRPPEQAPSTGWAGAPPAAVTWPQPPDLGGDPAAAHYRDTLLEMRARHTLTAVVGHLARHAEPLLALGPDTAAACADYLGRIDMLYKVGLDLLATRPADLDTVRELTHTHRLDSLPPQMHLEFLRFLLRHGDAVDLPPVVANWLPGTMPVLADAALERAADGRADLPDWLDACLRPTLAALPAAYTTDALLAALLGGFRPDDAAGELLVQATLPLLREAAARRHLPLPDTGRWLMDDAHVRFAHQHVRQLLTPGGRLPRVALDWLDAAAAGAPPRWLGLLHVAAGSGSPPTAGRFVNGSWIGLIANIATTHGRAPELVTAMIEDALRHLHRAASPDDEVRRWLRAIEFDQPAAQASVDFVLLCGDDLVPRGLGAGSPLARDPDYALTLLAHADDYGMEKLTFRRQLGLVLSQQGATGDAFVLLDAMFGSAPHGGSWMVEAAVAVAEAREELLDTRVPERLWKAMLAVAPHLELPAVLRRLEREIATGGAPGPVAELLLLALRLGCGPDQLRHLMLDWDGTYDQRRLTGLMEHLALGEDDPVMVAPGRGFRTLVMLIPPLQADNFAAQRGQLARRDADAAAADVAALRQQIDRLELHRLEQLEFAAVCDEHLGIVRVVASAPVRVVQSKPVPVRSPAVRPPEQTRRQLPDEVAAMAAPPSVPRQPPRRRWWWWPWRVVSAPVRYPWRALKWCWRKATDPPAHATAGRRQQQEESR